MIEKQQNGWREQKRLSDDKENEYGLLKIERGPANPRVGRMKMFKTKCRVWLCLYNECGRQGGHEGNNNEDEKSHETSLRPFLLCFPQEKDQLLAFCFRFCGFPSSRSGKWGNKDDDSGEPEEWEY